MSVREPEARVRAGGARQERGGDEIGPSAELTADEKNAQSHRGRAFGLLVTVLRERYG